MFCSKCGSKSIEGSAFCQKCGAKLIVDEAVQTAATNPIPPSPATSVEPKKKSKKLLFGIVGIVVVAIVAIIIALNSGDKTDYVMTVKAHTPFVSQGYSYTYGAVLNSYIDSPIWEVRKANDKISVNARGKTKDTGDSVLVSILVAVGANDQAVITPESVVIGSDKITGQDNVVRFLLDLFIAYDEGQSGTSTTKPNDTSYTTYTSEEHGFLFKYPSDWIDGGSQSVTEIIGVYDGYGARFSVAEIYVLPFELDTGNEALIESAINDNGIAPHKFVSVDDVGINGKVMRELIYTTENAVHGLLYVSNYFYFVGDKDYQITVELPADTVDNYQSVFETMMNSYTISETSGGSGVPSSDYSGEVLYDGIPLTQFFELGIGDIVRTFDAAVIRDEFKLEFGYIDFWHSDGKITSGESQSPDMFTINGATLETDRDGLVALLGEPVSENPNGGSGYEMTFDRGHYRLTIATGDYEGTAWRIWIYPSSQQNNGSTSSGTGSNAPSNNSNLDEQLFGTWVLQGVPDYVAITAGFNPDGTGSWFGDGPGQEFTWRTDGGALTRDVRENDTGAEWTEISGYEVSGDTLTITRGDGWEEVYRRE